MHVVPVDAKDALQIKLNLLREGLVDHVLHLLPTIDY